jgi:predicted HicB family RNase H-like nuclease
MSRLGPQAKKLFDLSPKTDKSPQKTKEIRKKYTFILSSEVMKQVKHTAVEQEKTISQWIEDAIKKTLPK